MDHGDLRVASAVLEMRRMTLEVKECDGDRWPSIFKVVTSSDGEQIGLPHASLHPFLSWRSHPLCVLSITANRVPLSANLACSIGLKNSPLETPATGQPCARLQTLSIHERAGFGSNNVGGRPMLNGNC